MAEENYISGHLDSYMHVFKGGPFDGTTARLYVTPWDRNTVADGYWQTVNTIQPLINRDIYLADAIDKLANKYTVYSAGFGVTITPVQDSDRDYYSISVNMDDILHNIPKYSFNQTYFTTAGSTTRDGEIYVGLRIDPEGSITAQDDGIYCNVDYLINATKRISSVSSISASGCSALTYEYTTAHGDYTFTSMLPINLGGVNADGKGKIYLVG